MGKYWKAILTAGACLACLSSLAESASAQAVPDDKPWHGRWIADPSAPQQGPGVHHFRNTFDLAAAPEHFVIRVSADNRYRLFVNGVEIGNGPARGDLLHWRYETYDIAAHLHAGRNVVAALVWNMGEYRPAAQVSLQTAFLVQGEGDAEVINTGASWKVLSDDAYRFARVVGDDSGGFYVAGPRESMDQSRYPWGWEQPAYDDSKWVSAAPASFQFASDGALPRGSQLNGAAAEWQLVPRNIPMTEATPTRFASVRRASGLTVPDGFVSGKVPLIIPAHTRASILLDHGTLTIGYPILRSTGGAGAEATLTYAESLFDAQGQKGNRSEIEGKTIRGLRDDIRFDGGSDREFRPLWLRAWRYMQIDVETHDEPLQISDVHTLFAAYPFHQNASFDSDAAWLRPIWDMDWRALRMSAFETFWDTPYYEQLQYVGDGRIEALMSVYQSGDARLMRNAIELFDHSRSSEGLTTSSYPSRLRQQIPSFSLWWIAMVHDYWMLRDDPQFVKAQLQGVRDVVDWFERHIDETGMVGPMPWWNFLDWTKSYKEGIPPGGGTGHATAFSLQFALVLKQAAEMEQALGRKEEAARDTALAERLIAASRLRAWDEKRGLFVDSPEHQVFSEQTNTLALLADAVPAGQDRAVMQQIVSDKSLVPATFYFRFYVDEALRKTGMADLYLDRLDPWKIMIANGMTTTAETPEPTRSDSHAWSAHPNYHLLATVLGIRPASPGFASVAIAPALGQLRRAAGTVPHPSGPIKVSYRRIGKAELQADIHLPAILSGRFEWQGNTLSLGAGDTHITCAATCTPTKAGANKR